MKFFAAALLLPISACGSFPSALTVRPEPMQYSPAMSSTPGIGLRTVYSPPAGAKVQYRWKTNFGYFVSWRAPDFKVVPMGADAVSAESLLYWTYDPALAAASKPVVSISIEVQDAESGRVLARAKLKLDWERDAARVRD